MCDELQLEWLGIYCPTFFTRVMPVGDIDRMPEAGSGPVRVDNRSNGIIGILMSCTGLMDARSFSEIV